MVEWPTSNLSYIPLHSVEIGNQDWEMEAKDLKFDTSPGKVIKTLSQKQNMKKRG
jgi:hypothetical protein